MTTIVFSKDRAMQLDAFLRSYQDHVVPVLPLHVLQLATSHRHAKVYDEVFQRYPWACPIEQGADFKSDLLDLLPADGNVVFFVDDMVFIRQWNVLEQPDLSLRLGLNLTEDYASSADFQQTPRYNMCGVDLISWKWNEGKLAWGYPLSVDGHVFDAAEISAITKEVDFRSPNTLEAALQRFLPRFLSSRGFCYTVSKTVNIPWNVTQTDWVNRHGVGNDVEDMLKHWESGKQIAVSQLYDVLNKSTHQEFPLVLEPR